MVVVLPVPGGPLKIMLGMFPPLTTACNLATVSSLPTTSLRTWGRYFSTQGCVDIVLGAALCSAGAALSVPRSALGRRALLENCESASMASRGDLCGRMRTRAAKPI